MAGEILQKVICFKCGIPWWVEKEVNSNWRRDKTGFFCPNGHSQAYIKSTAEYLRETLAERDAQIVKLKSENFDLKNPPKKKRKKHA